MATKRDEFLKKLADDSGFAFEPDNRVSIPRGSVRRTAISALQASLAPTEAIHHGLQIQQREQEGQGTVAFLIVLTRRLLEFQANYEVDPQLDVVTKVSIAERFIPIDGALTARIEFGASGGGLKLDRVVLELEREGKVILKLSGDERTLKRVTGLMAALSPAM